MPSDKVSDSYVKEEEREQGVWGGRAAKALGLEEAVTREAFIDLMNNKVPGTQERLTLRDKDQRRPGYDFCFSVPKSVSVYHAISGDRAVQRIVEEAVRTTMEYAEARMETRVRGKRAKGRDHDRVTGNLVYAAFTHTVTRPVDGIPDPHLHVHCYVANVTFDAEENRWKAGQFGEFVRPDPGGRLVTTREVLAQEEAMIEKALSGQGTCEELGRGA